MDDASDSEIMEHYDCDTELTTVCSSELEAGNSSLHLNSSETREHLMETLIDTGMINVMKQTISHWFRISGFTGAINERCIDYIKEKGEDNVNISHMMSDLIPSARESVPTDLRSRIQALLKSFALNHVTIDDTLDSPHDLEHGTSDIDLPFEYQPKDTEPNPGKGLIFDEPFPSPSGSQPYSMHSPPSHMHSPPSNLPHQSPENSDHGLESSEHPIEPLNRLLDMEFPKTEQIVTLPHEFPKDTCHELESRAYEIVISNCFVNMEVKPNEPLNTEKTVTPSHESPKESVHELESPDDEIVFFNRMLGMDLKSKEPPTPEKIVILSHESPKDSVHGRESPDDEIAFFNRMLGMDLKSKEPPTLEEIVILSHESPKDSVHELESPDDEITFFNRLLGIQAQVTVTSDIDTSTFEVSSKEHPNNETTVIQKEQEEQEVIYCEPIQPTVTVTSGIDTSTFEVRSKDHHHHAIADHTYSRMGNKPLGKKERDRTERERVGQPLIHQQLSKPSTSSITPSTNFSGYGDKKLLKKRVKHTLCDFSCIEDVVNAWNTNIPVKPAGLLCTSTTIISSASNVGATGSTSTITISPSKQAPVTKLKHILDKECSDDDDKDDEELPDI